MLREGEATLRGRAENAKLGAIVLWEDQPVYVDGLDSWPDNMVGRRVKITGTLEQRKLAPDPVGQNGEQVAGMWGEAWVFVGAEWNPDEDPAP